MQPDMNPTMDLPVTCQELKVCETRPGWFIPPSVPEVNAYLFHVMFTAALISNNFQRGSPVGGRSAGHMFSDNQRWCVKMLSARSIVSADVDAQVKGSELQPTHANELIWLNMQRALLGLYSGWGALSPDLWEQSSSIMSKLNEEWPAGEACLTRVKIVPANFARGTLQISFDFKDNVVTERINGSGCTA